MKNVVQIDIWALHETVLNAVIVKYNGSKEIWVVFDKIVCFRRSFS